VPGRRVRSRGTSRPSVVGRPLDLRDPRILVCGAVVLWAGATQAIYVASRAFVAGAVARLECAVNVDDVGCPSPHALRPGFDIFAWLGVSAWVAVIAALAWLVVWLASGRTSRVARQQWRSREAVHGALMDEDLTSFFADAEPERHDHGYVSPRLFRGDLSTLSSSGPFTPADPDVPPGGQQPT
jgi:hypothetical protein